MARVFSWFCGLVVRFLLVRINRSLVRLYPVLDHPAILLVRLARRLVRVDACLVRLLKFGSVTPYFGSTSDPFGATTPYFGSLTP